MSALARGLTERPNLSKSKCLNDKIAAVDAASFN
jgi:hypothetical protein